MNTNKHKKKIDSIIDLLKKNYSSTNEQNLKQKKGEIVQDHISRGLYNSTACIGKQLHADYDYIDGLIDFIIESLKKDFTTIRLEKCKKN
ncbi:MAG: hypothetical protein K8R02_00680 [Anaerohalosphaeraceae bacterium]|nr:hypothetical protein [Anaerohalosphaeraceae bacterium]